MPARQPVFRPHVESLEARDVPSAGMLDPTFGSGGVAVTQVGLSSSQANDVAVQPDNKVVVAGSAYSGSANRTDIAVVRYTPGGALDPTFGIATARPGPRWPGRRPERPRRGRAR